ncbi:unnamed protein product [Spirodela intermedia]|uniref:MaoC-like domain-containing protein n=1 Tax=Spirodela intermedia TaxID=51605 RepID=A0A7I8ICM7_SPIIN|nr:unnamed protein product [Spirodela intermedia]CAA6655520.1 unnamed protein product [Spirodela intermedia]
MLLGGRIFTDFSFRARSRRFIWGFEGISTLKTPPTWSPRSSGLGRCRGRLACSSGRVWSRRIPRPIVHGMLVASLFPRIVASHFPGAIYVSQTLHFRLPVYIDEEITAQIQPVGIREIKKRFIAKFSTKCFRDGGETPVLDGDATVILPTLTLKSWPAT